MQRTGSEMKPSFANLRAAYPRKSEKRAALYAELGFEELTDVPAYMNTCGIRMSYAFTRAGFPLQHGGLKINKGPYKGARIEASMGKLAHQLAEVQMLGEPEKYASEEAARKAIGRRRGVVAFFFTGIASGVGAQGHIDLVEPDANGFQACVGACFFAPRNKVWFWPLD